MFMHPLGFSPFPFIAAPIFGAVIAVLAVWSLVWKGFALWFSARNHQKWWFVAMLIVNTAGILEIVYLIWFRTPRTAQTASLFDAPAGPAAPAHTAVTSDSSAATGSDTKPE